MNAHFFDNWLKNSAKFDNINSLENAHSSIIGDFVDQCVLIAFNEGIVFSETREQMIYHILDLFADNPED